MRKMIKRITAAVAAAAMAVAMMGMMVFAANIPLTSTVEGASVGSDGTFSYNVVGTGFDVTKDATLVILFDGDPTNGFGGCIAKNSSSTNWATVEWGNEGADKPVTAEQLSDGKYKLTYAIPANTFTADDMSGAEGTWLQICLQQWWGEPINITGIELQQAPETGEASHIALYVIAALAAAGVVVCATRKKAVVER